MSDTTQLRTEIEYPDTDGKPIAENEPNFFQATSLVLALDGRFRDDTEVHVAGNGFVYYVKGRPEKNVAPDVFFVRGVADAKRRRRVYKVWVEERFPQFLVEVVSDSTVDNDRFFKKALYHEVFRAAEYVMIDVEGGNLSRPLIAHVWKPGGYVEADAGGRFRSEVLGLDLVVGEDDYVRLYERDGRLVPGSGVEGIELGRAEGIELGRAEGIELGRAKGIELGRTEGIAEGARQALSLILETRFGPLSASLRARVESIDDVERLKALLGISATATSIEELGLH